MRSMISNVPTDMPPNTVRRQFHTEAKDLIKLSPTRRRGTA